MMEHFEILIFVPTIILSYFVYRYLFVRNDYWKAKGISCVDGAIPIIGHNWPVLCFRKSFIGLFFEFYKRMGNRSMIGYYNFYKPGLIIRDPELIKTVMLSEFKNFDKNTSSLNPHLDPLLADNPFFAAGHKWKTNRTVLLSTFTCRKLKFIAMQLQKVCEKFSHYIEKQMILGNGNFSVNIQELMSRFTAEVVAIVAFGIDGKSFTDKSKTFETTVKQMYHGNPGYADKLHQIIVLFFPFLTKITRKRFMPHDINNYFRQIIKDVLQNRRETGEFADDFLQNVTQLCQNEEHAEDNEKTVTSHAASFFLDGYITSSITMTFAAYQIAANPTIQTKLREEVMKIFEKYNGKITYESLQEMKYMEQVINESLRLFPALPYLGKICTKEIKLVGNDSLECIVQPGTEVIVCAVGLHRDPLFWENPNVFDPERFSDDKKNQRHKYVYLPFGSGPRICVGMRVAMMQMKAAFATLLKNYSIHVHPKTKEPIKMHPLSALFAVPDGELWLRVQSLK